jgi:hypothetical protein
MAGEASLTAVASKTSNCPALGRRLVHAPARRIVTACLGPRSA